MQDVFFRACALSDQNFTEGVHSYAHLFHLHCRKQIELLSSPLAQSAVHSSAVVVIGHHALAASSPKRQRVAVSWPADSRARVETEAAAKFSDGTSVTYRSRLVVLVNVQRHQVRP